MYSWLLFCLQLHLSCSVWIFKARRKRKRYRVTSVIISAMCCRGLESRWASPLTQIYRCCQVSLDDKSRCCASLWQLSQWALSLKTTAKERMLACYSASSLRSKSDVQCSLNDRLMSGCYGPLIPIPLLVLMVKWRLKAILCSTYKILKDLCIYVSNLFINYHADNNIVKLYFSVVVRATVFEMSICCHKQDHEFLESSTMTLFYVKVVSLKIPPRLPRIEFFTLFPRGVRWWWKTQLYLTRFV